MNVMIKNYLVLLILRLLGWLNFPPTEGPYLVQIDEIEMGVFKSSGSQNAIVAYPLNYEEEKMPCILFVHGYLAGGTYIMEAFYGGIIRKIAS